MTLSSFNRELFQCGAFWSTSFHACLHINYWKTRNGRRPKTQLHPVCTSAVLFGDFSLWQLWLHFEVEECHGRKEGLQNSFPVTFFADNPPSPKRGLTLSEDMEALSFPERQKELAVDVFPVGNQYPLGGGTVGPGTQKQREPGLLLGLRSNSFPHPAMLFQLMPL